MYTTHADQNCVLPRFLAIHHQIYIKTYISAFNKYCLIQEQLLSWTLEAHNPELDFGGCNYLSDVESYLTLLFAIEYIAVCCGAKAL